MRFLVLSALCALAIASRQIYQPSIDIQDDSFRSGREYKFVYEGQLATGLPGASKQHSASRLQAIVHLIFKGEDNEVVLKLNHVRMAKLNEHLNNPQALLPFEACEQVEISEKHQRTLQLPLKFQYSQGLIEHIVLSGAERPWSSNIKRGVLNLLQVNLNKRNQIKSADRIQQLQQNNNQNSFRALENTLEGRCETLYTVLSEQSQAHSTGPIFNVTKSINFENCDRRPDIKYNFRFQSKCPSCEPQFNEEEKFLRSSSVGQYNISGTQEKFIIESARMESIYTFAPVSQQHSVITTYVNQTLRLFKSGPVESQVNIQNPQQSDSDLIYTPEWDVLKEKFFMEGEEQFHQQNPYSELPNKVELVETILTRLANSIQQNVVQQEAPVEFSRLVKVLRMLKKTEIRQVHDNFYKNVEQRLSVEKSKKVKDVLIDALAFAGTKDCVEHLVEKIQSGEVAPVQAGLAIKALINNRVISQQIVEKLMELAETNQSPFLRQSVLLTVGSLINGMCSPNEDKLGRQFQQQSNSKSPLCPPQFKHQMAEKFNSLLENEAQNWDQQILLIKTISNAGLLETVPTLAKIIRSNEYKTMVRAEAVLALRQVRQVIPRQVQEMLLPVFNNRQMPTRLRIAAVYQIMQTQPERVVIDQITRKLQNMRNKQVLTFTATLLHELANSTNPCEQKLAQNVQTSLRAGRGISTRSWMHPLRSKFVKINTPRSTFEIDFASMIGSEFKLPQHIASSLHLQGMGFWAKHLATLGLVQSETDELVRSFLLRNPIHSEDESTPRGASPLQYLNNIVNKLSINSRLSDVAQMPRGYLYLKLKGQEFGFLPMGQQIYRELAQWARQYMDMPSLKNMLSETHRFEITKAVLAHEMEYKIPTSLGLPLAVNVIIPSVVHFSGTIRVNVQSLDRQMPKQIEIETNMKPSGIVAMKVDVQTWSPVLNNGAGVRMFAKAHYPVKGLIQLDLSNLRQPVLEAKWEPAPVAINALTLSTVPFTMTRVWPQQYINSWVEAEYKTVMGGEQNRAVEYTREFGRRSLGLNFKIQGFQHSLMPEFVSRYGLPQTPGYFLSGPNKLQLTVEPGQQMPKEVVFRATGHMLKNINEQMQSGSSQYRQAFQDRFFQNQQENNEQDWNQQTDSPLESRIKLELFTQGSSINRKAQLETTIKMSKDLKMLKTQTKIERSPVPELESQPWKLCLDSEVIYPNTPYTFAQLTGKSAYSQVKATWGKTCDSDKFVRFLIKARQSEQQQQQNERHQRYWESDQQQEDQFEMSRRSPVDKYEHLKNAASLLQYNIDVHYNNVPKIVRNMTAKAFNMFKQYNFCYTQSDLIAEDLPEQRIRAQVSLDERSRQLVNISMESPLERTIITDIPLRFPVVRTLNLRREQQIQSSEDLWTLPTQYSMRPVCKVNDRRISTFDQVVYRVPVPDCWTVLAKDCSNKQQPTFAVLIKNKQSRSESKALKIVSRFNTVVIEPKRESYDSLMVKVNNQSPVQPEEVQEIQNHGHVVLRVRKEGEYIRVELPESGVTVHFDGYTASIKVSPMRVNEMCGLCGHFDYDQQNEFQSPDNNNVDDVRQFVRQYIMNEDNTQCLPEQDNQICNNERCESEYEKYEYFQDQDQDQNQNQNQNKNKNKNQQEPQSRNNKSVPRRATKVVERNGELCFSKQPVPICPRNSYAMEKSEKTRVVFTCLPRSDMNAERMFRRAEDQRQVIDEVRDMEETFFKKIAFPTRCAQW